LIEQVEKHRNEKRKVKERQERMGSFEEEVLIPHDESDLSSSEEDNPPLLGGRKEINPTVVKRKSLISPGEWSDL
jgi:hypothetical protein